MSSTISVKANAIINTIFTPTNTLVIRLYDLTTLRDAVAAIVASNAGILASTSHNQWNPGSRGHVLMEALPHHRPDHSPDGFRLIPRQVT